MTLPEAVELRSLEAKATRFLYHEAELLDARRLEEWLDLFEPAGRLWVPGRPAGSQSPADPERPDPDPNRSVSIIYEELPRLRLRVARLLSGKEYAQDPPSTTVRQLSNVAVDALSPDGGDGEVVVRSVCVIYEHWGIRPMLVLPARARHRLTITDDGFRIREKRLDLLEPDRFFENLSFLL